MAKTNRFRIPHAVTGILTALVLQAGMSLPAFAEEVHHFDIESTEAAVAIHQFGSQSGVQILASADVLNGKRLNRISGDLSTDDGFRRLLAGTGISHRYVGERTVALVPEEPVAKTDSSQTRSVQQVDETGTGTREGRQGFWSRFRLAQADTASKTDRSSRNEDQKTSDYSPESSEKRTALTEVIVTAQKRRERLIDTPQSMSVLTADDLTRIGATKFRDFANTVPGLSFITTGAGYTQVSLRGVTTGAFDISSTVGIYVDEVPYGSSSAFASGGQYALDVGLFDIDRIEVLRGPQGTLYGASTMGGLIKYVSKRPDATRFGVDAQTGISDTRDGGVSYNGAVTVNVPIASDKAAVRASGFYSRDGGYIDNLTLGQEDVNRSGIYGGRVDLSFTPTNALTIRLGGFLQNIYWDGEGTADYAFAGAPVDGRLDQRRPFAEPFDQRFRLVSGTVTYDLGPATLTSISSYQTVRTEQFWDISSFAFLCEFGGISCSAIGAPNDVTTDKFTQEVRFASEKTEVLEWLIGGFYTHETSEYAQNWVLRDLDGQPVPNNLFTFLSPTRYDEYAAFTDLTYYLTSKFDVSGGVRYARNRQRLEQFGTGLFGVNKPTSRSSEDVFTYLANARYDFSDHATGYLRYATGYRPGGPNFAAIDPTTGLPVGPETFDSDKLKSYEIGFKAETADRRFGIDVAGYFIDWSNFQILVASGGFSGTTNAPGGARVRGAELALTAHTTRAFTVTGAFAYQDAVLSEAEPNLGGGKGERLPNVPRLTAALDADYELPVGNLQPTLGATLRYVDDRKAGFGNTAYRLPDYTTVDLRAGFTLGPINTQLYVHNLFDKRGQLSAYTWRGLPQPAILQPRTVGLQFSYSFE